MCIFCKISQKELQSDVVFESDDIIAFRDNHPIAPVHILIIPKRHVEDINNIEDSDSDLVGRMFLVARDLAKKEEISEGGYKLLIRVGKDGGQEIGHLHLHLIGGANLFEEIRPV